jgi:hypothetical protein
MKNVENSGGARRHKLRHNTAHECCMLDKQHYTHARTHAHTHAHVPGHPTKARKQEGAHTDKYSIIHLLFHGENDSRKRPSVTSYVHCLSCYSVIP